MSIESLLTSEDLIFRQQVRAFCQEVLPPSTRIRVATGAPLEKHDYVDWQRRLASRGWLTPIGRKTMGVAIGVWSATIYLKKS